jgi:hypothetical protein
MQNRFGANGSAVGAAQTRPSSHAPRDAGAGSRHRRAVIDQPDGGTSRVGEGGQAPPEAPPAFTLKWVPEHPAIASGVHVGPAAIG